jgi:hypothetical protein
MFPQILLRLEKYHYRINYAKGILETRNVTYNRSMRKLAKPLPLDTPTTIELAPGNSIRVTLIDANHCVGAVMFLIEGDGRAILYTGDIRAETWWVNSLVRNPVLIPYTFGKRRLNCIYLDTTFATKSEPYREFPGKAEGIQELLHKVSQYSEDTIFYFHAWTFGYEDVWVALSTSLGSRIHLDDYRAGIYGSLSTLQKRQLTEIGLNVQADNKSLRESGLEIREAPALCGFRNGNHIHPGCLTSQESVRIYSCERGMGCQVMDHDKKAKSVHIIPIITRANGVDIAELGAGGGKGDLDQKEALEMSGVVEIGKLMELCAATIKDAKLLSEVLALLHQTLARNDGKLDLDTHLHKTSGNSQGGLSLHTLASVLSANASKSATIDEPLNRTIRFPYSRHSSYSELCELVAAFRPDDIFPCTVDEEHWTPALSMQNLFGDLCTEHTFRHDAEMTRLYITKTQEHHRVKRNWKETQNDTQTSNEKLPVIQPNVKWIADSNEDDSYSAPADCATPVESINETKRKLFLAQEPTILYTPTPAPPPNSGLGLEPSPCRSFSPAPDMGIALRSSSLEPIVPLDVQVVQSPHSTIKTAPVSVVSIEPPASCVSNAMKKRKKLTNRQLAYEAAIGTHLTWADFGGLTSTRKKEDREEHEL